MTSKHQQHSSFAEYSHVSFSRINNIDPLQIAEAEKTAPEAAVTSHFTMGEGVE